MSSCFSHHLCSFVELRKATNSKKLAHVLVHNTYEMLDCLALAPWTVTGDMSRIQKKDIYTILLSQHMAWCLLHLGNTEVLSRLTTQPQF